MTARKFHKVLLIHGIRTNAEWLEAIGQEIDGIGGFKAVTPRFGWFDVVRFWLPVRYFRNAKVNEIGNFLKEEINRANTRSVSVIAHSFGTYIIGTLLRRDRHLRIDKLIVCGSILPSNFDWAACQNQITGRDKTDQYLLVNDCGIKDVWPLLAESTTYGYGHSGRRGFNSPTAKNRFFDYGHSSFFTKEHFHTYWKPFLLGSEVVEPPALGKTYAPYWLTFLSLFMNLSKYAATLLLLAAAALAAVDVPPLDCSNAFVRHLPLVCSVIDPVVDDTGRGPARKLSDAALRARFGQIFLIGFDGRAFNSEIPGPTEKRIREMQIGGLLFNRRNLLADQMQIDRPITKTALIGKVRRIREYLRTEFGASPFVAADHEGGVASQLMKYSFTSQYPAAMALAAYNNVRIIEDVTADSIAELSALGFNMNLGPVLDLNNEWQNTDIRDRSYSGDSRTVSEITRRIVEAHNNASLIAVAKHFPGHGSTLAGFETAGLVVTRQTPTTIKHSLEPFRRMAQVVPAIMTSHMKIEKLGIDNVTSDRRVISGLLKGATETVFRGHSIPGLAFRGLVVADNLNEVSLTASSTASCEENKSAYVARVYQESLKAFDAGHDVLLFSHVFDGDGSSEQATTFMSWVRSRSDRDTCYRWALTTSEFKSVFDRLRDAVFHTADEDTRYRRVEHLRSSLRKIAALKEQYGINRPTPSTPAEAYHELLREHRVCSRALQAFSFTTLSDRQGAEILTSLRALGQTSRVLLFSFVDTRADESRRIDPATLDDRYHTELVATIRLKVSESQLKVVQLKRAPTAGEYGPLASRVLAAIADFQPSHVLFLIDKYGHPWPLVQDVLLALRSKADSPLEPSTIYIFVTRNPLIVNQDSTDQKRQALLSSSTLILFSNYREGSRLQYGAIFRPDQFTLPDYPGLLSTTLPVSIHRLHDVNPSMTSREYSCE